MCNLGKSTTIGMLTGLLRPTAGSALIYGQDIVEARRQRMFGVCPQHDVLFDKLTVSKNWSIDRGLSIPCLRASEDGNRSRCGLGAGTHPVLR